MRYAIMSDVHANPAALELALKDADKQGCERFLMLGDTTGYGYDVKKSVQLVRKSFDIVLLGNHDSACIGREPAWELEINPHYATDVAQGKTLSARDRTWLGRLPYLHFEGGAGFVHGRFIRPEGWGYVIDDADAAANLKVRGERLLFCGHTHVAAAWERQPNGLADGMKLFKKPAVKAETKGFKLKKDRRYLVNVGSVGYPRNDLCSTYVIWDTEADRVDFRRLPFDFKGYIKNMTRAGLPMPDWLLDLFAKCGVS